MAWLELTLDSGETRLVNLDKFIFVRPEGEGSYLVCVEPSQSVMVAEPPDAIEALLARTSSGSA